jgi:catalase
MPRRRRNQQPEKSAPQVEPSQNDNVTNAIRNHAGEYLTTDQGVTVADDQNSLRVGERGPTLMDDFILREKLAHFDHERIPERVVHARGSGAHGYFQVYESLADFTSAAFLQDPAVQTPVFVRFSTVAGSRGSADTVRDVRGFATKFYTGEGNFDLVGNNMPVFFIQDAIKFPDLVHAVKPEPNHEMPQAQSAHDTFWDFIWLTPESAHMIMWLMSDRAIPRSFAMMEGFGVHTFRMVNAEGHSRFVKFHWKPVLGIHSLVWDEAQKLAGRDPDFLRRDLWDSIEAGNFPEYELGLQVMEEDEVNRFEFDVLDPTKIVPEEVVPVHRVGRLVLNRNPENFFAETEQVAFHLGNLVPGIDVSDDPLLQGRLFSYLDTQLIRLGGPNFPQLPINQPLIPVHHNQRDGYHQMHVDQGRTSYSPNSIQGGHPMEAGASADAFLSHPAPLRGEKVRVRSERFTDHFSQATLFYRSMSAIEQEHIAQALRFELGKLTVFHVRERVVDLLMNIDADLAATVAAGIGVDVPSGGRAQVLRAANDRLMQGWEKFGTTSLPGRRRRSGVEVSEALSQMRPPPVSSPKGRKVAVLAADGVDAGSLSRVIQGLARAQVTAEVVSLRQGSLAAANGTAVVAQHTVLTMPSVVYDGVFVPGGVASVEALMADGDARHYIAEAYKHCKPIGADQDAEALLSAAGLDLDMAGDEVGVLLARTAAEAREMPARLLAALTMHRFFNRADAAGMPA